MAWLRKFSTSPGKFVNADLDKASTENERNAVVIDANGQLVTLVQVAGLIARRILCYIHVGDRSRQAKDMALFVLGPESMFIYH